MRTHLRILIAVTVAATISTAGFAATEDEKEHATHHPDQAASQAVPATQAKSYDRQMKAMDEMHRKMQSAKTAEERSALMHDHMKAMKDGMAMMCDMQSHTGTQTMMKQCTAMKDMTMQMMMDREIPSAK